MSETPVRDVQLRESRHICYRGMRKWMSLQGVPKNLIREACLTLYISQSFLDSLVTANEADASGRILPLAAYEE